MPTNLTSPKHLAAQIESIGRGLMDESRRVAALEKTVESLLADGVAPLTVKSYIDTLLAGSKAVLQRYGDVLGDTTTPSNPTLPMSFATRWKAGAPAGAGYYRVGAGSEFAFLQDTTLSYPTQQLRLISVSDSPANEDMFLGLKKNDVIRIDGCTDYRNNGRRTLAYDVDDVGNGGSTYGLTQGDFSGSGSDWTAGGTGLTVNTGKAIYTGTTGSGSATQALSGMSTAAAYEIKFEVGYSAGTNYIAVLTVDLGGSWFFQRRIDSSDKATTYSFVSDTPSATPTLSISCQFVSGSAGSVSIDNITVKGFNGIFVNEPFYSDAGGVSGESPYNDTGVVITLEQTAA